MNKSKAIVALKQHCAYDSALQKAVEELLSQIGGMAQVVKPGQNVLIKPNLLTDKKPDQAVTTHPELIRCIIRSVRDCGGKPSVGDSSASAVKTEKVWSTTGVRTVCEEENVPLLNFEKMGSINFSDNGLSFNIAKPVIECDVLINMPKVKTHVLTTFTCAVKNLYGTIPGYQKALLHKNHPTANDFGKLIASLYRHVKPSLSIADGISAMEGEGPSGGKIFQLNLLAASTDAVALDLALCDILKINPKTVPYLRILTDIDNFSSNYECSGEKIETIKPQSFLKPGTMKARLIPGFIVKLLQPYIWIRPKIEESCRKCGRCVKACPAGALVQDENKKKPGIIKEKCIGCCCCHEVCPYNAITIVQSPLLNLARKGKLP